MLDVGSVIAYLQDNPINALMFLFVIYRFWQSRQPFPETGGRVKSINSMADWTATLAKAAEEKKVVCAEFYATW